LASYNGKPAYSFIVSAPGANVIEMIDAVKGRTAAAQELHRSEKRSDSHFDRFHPRSVHRCAKVEQTLVLAVAFVILVSTFLNSYARR